MVQSLKVKEKRRRRRKYNDRNKSVYLNNVSFHHLLLLLSALLCTYADIIQDDLFCGVSESDYVRAHRADLKEKRGKKNNIDNK